MVARAAFARVAGAFQCWARWAAACAGRPCLVYSDTHTSTQPDSAVAMSLPMAIISRHLTDFGLQ